jgi:hypothetical protein
MIIILHYYLYIYFSIYNIINNLGNLGNNLIRVLILLGF